MTKKTFVEKAALFITGSLDSEDAKAIRKALKQGFDERDIIKALKNADLFFNKNNLVVNTERLKASLALKNYETIKGFINYGDH